MLMLILMLRSAAVRGWSWREGVGGWVLVWEGGCCSWTVIGRHLKEVLAGMEIPLL